MVVYIVDSNFFIQAHRDTYPLDIAHSYWNKVKQLAHDGKIISIDKVQDELYDKNDELEAWCKANLPNDFFKDTSTIMNEYQQVIAWAATRMDHYLQKAFNEFLAADEADAFIVAYALVSPSERIIVTQEISDPQRKNKIKIPEPCKALDIRYIRSMELFRELRESF